MKAFMKYIIGITAGLLLLSATSFGQTNAITGFVYDEDWNPIPSVQVTLSGAP